MSVIVWNVVGSVFGPEVSHFDVFPLHWALMFLLKVQDCIIKMNPFPRKAIKMYEPHDYDTVHIALFRSVQCVL